MSGDELPGGWAISTLGAIGRLFCGQSPPISAVNQKGEGTPYITGPEHWDGIRLSVEKWTTEPRRIVPDGCLFVTVKGAGVGKLFQGIACAIGRDVYAYQPETGVSPKFIEFALGFKLRQLLAKAQGDIPGLSKDHILDQEVLFPPVNEQIRIVYKLEELLSDLDAGVAALERARANLKKYRAAVLKAAVTGDLTADWRAAHPHAEPATKLLDRILAERGCKWEADQQARFAVTGRNPPKDWRLKYDPPVLPDLKGLPELPLGWCWVSVDQIAEVGTGTTPLRSSKEFYEGGTIPWILSTAVNETHITGAAEFVTDHAVRQSRLRLYPKHTLLIAMYGEGKTRGKVSELLIEATINQALAALVLNGTAANCRPFVKHVLLSNYEHMRRQAAGGMQPNLNLGLVEKLVIPLAPFAEQQVITNEVEQRLSVIAASENYIAASLKRASRLRQSILKEAFAGRLVPQDPTDEPASALLDRIRQARSNGHIASTVARPRGRRKHPDPTVQPE